MWEWPPAKRVSIRKSYSFYFLISGSLISPSFEQISCNEGTAGASITQTHERSWTFMNNFHVRLSLATLSYRV